MKYNVSIIKFEELQRIISDIDYLSNSLEYVEFAVINGDKFTRYCAGIGQFGYDVNLKLKYHKFADIVSEEPQYIVDATHDIILDLQDPDAMVFEQIGEILKKKCNITEYSDILLYKYEPEEDEVVDEERLNLAFYKMDEILKQKLNKELKELENEIH